MKPHLRRIVSIFGLLGVSISSVFFWQNATDLKLYFQHNSSWSIAENQQECAALSQDFFPCLLGHWTDYAQTTAITGLSLGLKKIFSLLDAEKRKLSVLPLDALADFHSSQEVEQALQFLNFQLHYIAINNVALNKGARHYYGFAWAYPGHVESLQHFLSGGREFHDHLVTGIKNEGLNRSKLVESVAKFQLTHNYQQVVVRMEKLEHEFEQAYASFQRYIEEKQRQINRN